MQAFGQMNTVRWLLGTLGEFKRLTLLAQSWYPVPAFQVPQQFRGAGKTVFFIAGCFAVAAFVLGFGGPSTAFVAYAAALAFGGALLVSLKTVFIVRYEVPLDPLVIIVIVSGLGLSVRKAYRIAAGEVLRASSGSPAILGSQP